MSQRRAIPIAHLPELVARSRAGASLRDLVAWLQTQGVSAAPNTVRHALVRASDTGEVLAAIAQEAERRAALEQITGEPQGPVAELMEADPEAPAERLRNMRLEIARERFSARQRAGRDWKRYHSALRLTIELLKIDIRPVGGRTGLPAGDQPEGAPPAQPLVLFDSGAQAPGPSA